MQKVTEGELVYLRMMTPEDTDAIVRWRNNPRVRSCFIYQKPFTREGHEHWVHTKVETGEVIQLVIVDKSTDRAVGSVYFRDISQEHHKAEYGIFIGEDDAVGKGIGSEVCRLACSWAFETQHWHKIILRAFAENGRAIRSYEKAGFVQEALLRDEVCIDDVYRNIVLMGLWNPEDC